MVYTGAKPPVVSWPVTPATGIVQVGAGPVAPWVWLLDKAAGPFAADPSNGTALTAVEGIQGVEFSADCRFTSTPSEGTAVIACPWGIASVACATYASCKVTASEQASIGAVSGVVATPTTGALPR
jgi:hypothetical protein